MPFTFPMMGTLVNALTVIAGSFVGLALRKHINEELMKLPMQCMGLFTLCIGASMALKMGNPLIVIFSLCTGSVIGSLIDIDARVERFSNRVQTRFSSLGSNFSQGLVTATLLFCIGSMAVLGSFEDGLGGYPTLLLTKSVMDGLSAVALSSTLGVGVLFAFVPLLAYQGALTLAARAVQPFMTEAAVLEMTAVGGVMLVGMGLVILGVAKIKLMNALPALVIAVLLVSMLS